MVTVQLPDGASLERTERVMDELTQLAGSNPGGRAHDRHRRRLASRQQRLALQRRDPVPDVQGLEGAREGRGPPVDLQGPLGRLSRFQDARDDGPGAAADPGPGAFRRVPDAGRADRRQLRLRRACRKRPTRIVAEAGRDPAIRIGLHAVARLECRRLTDRDQKTQAETLGLDRRRRLRHRAELSRIELRQPVHRFGHSFMVYRAGRRASTGWRRTTSTATTCEPAAARWSRSAPSPDIKPTRAQR